MNLSNVKSIVLPEGNVSGIAICGVNVWAAKKKDKYTWDAVFASIAAGTYATDYAIGDLIPLDLGSEGVVNMQIVGFDVDNKADGSGKAPISWISKELLANKYAYGRQVTDWSDSFVRSNLNDAIKPKIPDIVRTRLLLVTKTSISNSNTSQAQYISTQDDVWIPSANECNSASSLYAALFGNTSTNRIKTRNGTAEAWNLRDKYDGTYNYAVNNSGTIGTTWSSASERGIALGFCT